MENLEIKYPDGSIYVGETKNGLKNGWGKFIRSFELNSLESKLCAIVYFGEWENDKYNGFGTQFIYTDGNTKGDEATLDLQSGGWEEMYEGQWKEGKKMELE